MEGTIISTQAAGTSTLSGLFAGLGAGSGGLSAGLQGLFAALVGGGEEASTNRLITLLQDMGVTEQDVAGESATGLSDILAALANVDFDAEGMAGDTQKIKIETLGVQLEELSVTLQQAGISSLAMGNSEDLAAALHTQGMSLEEAVAEADRIDSALQTMREKLGLTEEDGSLLPQLAEALKSMENPFIAWESTTSLTQISVEVTASTTEVPVDTVARSQQVALFAQQGQNAPVKDVAEKVIQDQPLLPQAPAKTTAAAPTTAVDAAAPTPASASTPQASVGADAVVDGALAEEVVTETQETVARQAGQFSQVTGEDVAEAPAAPPRAKVANHEGDIIFDARPVAKTVTATGAATESGYEGLRATSETVTNAPEPIQGTTVYKWQPTKTGNDVLTQVQDPAAQADAAEVMADMMETQAEEVEGLERNNAPRQSFAEKMALLARQAQVAQQIAPSVKTAINNGGGQVRVTLHPEELGEVEIDLKIKDGQVHGTIAAQNPEVIEQLARELHQLKQGLNDAGFQLGDEGIAFMLQEDGGHQSGEQGQQGSGFAAADATTEEGVLGEEATAAANWTSPDQLVDVRV